MGAALLTKYVALNITVGLSFCLFYPSPWFNSSLPVGKEPNPNHGTTLGASLQTVSTPLLETVKQMVKHCLAGTPWRKLCSGRATYHAQGGLSALGNLQGMLMQTLGNHSPAGDTQIARSPIRSHTCHDRTLTVSNTPRSYMQSSVIR